MINLAGVTKATWTRLAVLLAALINQALVTFGASPFDEGDLTNLITCAITVVVTVYCYWKNNSFTKEAQECDKNLKK